MRQYLKVDYVYISKALEVKRLYKWELELQKRIHKYPYLIIPLGPPVASKGDLKTCGSVVLFHERALLT